MPNCIIAQSGGPTSVINSSVVGLIKANEEFKVYDKIYGGLNGIEGILNKNIIDLSSTTNQELEEFKYTPSSGLGSCRYKMKNIEDSTEEYDKILEILQDLDIKTFFYIGGNDSMDTTAKLGKYAKENNLDINFVGIPKTIDNDLMYTDHTPGFASAAKYIAISVLETYLDSSVYTNNGIFILETMGRDTGWLAASACTAKYLGKPVVDFIYLPEVAFDKDQFLKDVEKRFKENNHVYIVVSEGIRDASGKFVSEFECVSQDKFGHTQLGGVCNYIRSLILDTKITTRVKALELGVLQRCAITLQDLIIMVIKYAMEGNNGQMVAIKRESNKPYKSSFFLVEADKIANNVKYFPTEWINKEGNNVTPEAYEYFKPMLGELPDFKVFTK